MLVCALAIPASAQAIVVGIADQKPDMFGDTRFQALEIKHARYYVPWDWNRYGWQRAEVDAWMNAARAEGVHPLVSFGHSRVHRRSLPSVKGFQRQFKAFRKRYPWVLNFATWNEANHCGEPVCHKPRLVVKYWRALERTCRQCKVLAAELLDVPSMGLWVKQFLKAAKKQPANWGLHNYVEANRFRTTSLKRLLTRVTGRIWLTEVGGLVARRGTQAVQKNRVKGLPESTRHAAKVTRYLFRKVLTLSPRITRVYLYHWNSTSTKDSWDSAFINARGKIRPAYTVFVRELERLRARIAKRRR